MGKSDGERLDKIERILKRHRQEIDDLWTRVNAQDDAHGVMEDETREIAERARRLAQRTARTVEELNAEN